MVLYDRMFSDISPYIVGLSENETHCFGRFCCLLLDTIQRWHSSKATFESEAEGYPGCLTRVKKTSDNQSAVEGRFDHDEFRAICYKWHFCMSKSFGLLLTANKYIERRNVLIMLTKLLPSFPLVTAHVKSIEKHVDKVREEEKQNNRNDLSVMAASYLAQLKRRNITPVPTEQFYIPKTKAKTTNTTPKNQTPKTKKEDTDGTRSTEKRKVPTEKDKPAVSEKTSNGAETPTPPSKRTKVAANVTESKPTNGVTKTTNGNANEAEVENGGTHRKERPDHPSPHRTHRR
jgi:THO complex subunit 2